MTTRAWYITYQANTTINKNYKRVTEGITHEIPKLYALKTEKRTRDLSVRRANFTFNVSSTQVLKIQYDIVTQN